MRNRKLGDRKLWGSRSHEEQEETEHGGQTSSKPAKGDGTRVLPPHLLLSLSTCLYWHTELVKVTDQWEDLIGESTVHRTPVDNGCP